MLSASRSSLTNIASKRTQHYARIFSWKTYFRQQQKGVDTALQQAHNCNSISDTVSTEESAVNESGSAHFSVSQSVSQEVFMNKRLSCALAAVLLATVFTVSGLMHLQSVRAQTDSAEAAITLPQRFSYAAKFVCGVQQQATVNAPAEPPVKPGNYATVINIHNPWARPAHIVKKVALAAPETFPDTKLIPPTKRYHDRLPSDHGMSIDCSEIVNLLRLNGTPPAVPFIEGWVVIDSYFFATPGAAGGPAALDVVAVTTTGPITAAGGPPFVNDHEVTVVPGRSLPAGTWPF
jgi:hypothetical protein